jgi:hypothetical protein
MVPASERPKTAHALDRSATVIGPHLITKPFHSSGASLSKTFLNSSVSLDQLLMLLLLVFIISKLFYVKKAP